jgi:hypothetical protein
MEEPQKQGSEDGGSREEYPGPGDSETDETQPGENALMREQEAAGAGERPPGTT